MCPAGAVWVWNSTHQSASVKKKTRAWITTYTVYCNTPYNK